MSSGTRSIMLTWGLPTPRYDEGSITADVDGVQVYDISSSGFQGDGPGVDAGVAIGLGAETILPGQTGTVHVYIPVVESKLQYDTQGDQYASAVFAPAWFQTVHGTTDLTVTFHLPPGVKPEEPRWHEAPAGFSSEPTTGIDDQGRITYTWHNPNVTMNRKYDLGASFPLAYVPQDTIYRPGILETVGIDPDDFYGFAFCCGIVGFIVLISALSVSIKPEAQAAIPAAQGFDRGAWHQARPDCRRSSHPARAAARQSADHDPLRRGQERRSRSNCHGAIEDQSPHA